MTSGRDQKELTGVSLLGNKTKYPTDYAPEVLEAFINKHPGNDYFVKFNRYTTEGALDYYRKGKKPSALQIIFNPIYKFIKMYIIRLGSHNMKELFRVMD